MTGLTNGEVHYFTGVMLEPAAGVNPYFDGNFSPSFDYRFEGTPNQSVSDYYPAMQTKLTRLAEILPAYIPIGSTFSLYTGANVWGNLNLYTGTL